MKIAFVHDYRAEEYKGGEELSLRKFQEEGRKRGHDILEMSFSDYDRKKLQDSDIVILGNISLFNLVEIEWIADNKKTVKYEADYGFCAFERSANCEICKLEGKCKNPFYDFLYEKVRLIVYLNPAQREIYRRFFGNKVNNSILCFPFYSDEKAYHDKKLERIKDSVIYPHRLVPLKGIDRAVAFAATHPDSIFFFAGRNLTPKLLPMIKTLNNGVYLGDIAFQTMPHLFNLMEKVMFLGNWRDTGPMSIIEANLCGCQIIHHNALIISWNWKNTEELRKLIREAPDIFYKKLEELK